MLLAVIVALVIAIYILLFIGFLSHETGQTTNVTSYADLELMRSRFRTLDDIERAEDCIVNNPSDKETRRQVLRAYLFLFPDLTYSEQARSHVYWFIENEPQSSLVWVELSTHFLPPVHKDVQRLAQLWGCQIETSHRDAKVVENAATFLSLIAPDISLRYWEELRVRFPLDPMPVQKISHLYSRMLGRARESLNYFQILESMRWTHEDAAAVERLRVLTGRSLWPNFVCSWLLKIYVILRARNETLDLVDITAATEMALKCKDDSLLSHFSNKLYNIIMSFEKYQIENQCLEDARRVMAEVRSGVTALPREQ